MKLGRKNSNAPTERQISKKMNISFSCTTFLATHHRYNKKIFEIFLYIGAFWQNLTNKIPVDFDDVYFFTHTRCSVYCVYVSLYGYVVRLSMCKRIVHPRIHRRLTLYLSASFILTRLF